MSSADDNKKKKMLAVRDSTDLKPQHAHVVVRGSAAQQVQVTVPQPLLQLAQVLLLSEPAQGGWVQSEQRHGETNGVKLKSLQ